MTGGLAAAGGGPAMINAADDPDWREVLAIAAPGDEAKNACHRWQVAIADLPALGSVDQALVTGEIPDEQPASAVVDRLRSVLERFSASLDAFEILPGEDARFPEGTRMGQGFPDFDVWQTLVRLKLWQVRMSWWRDERTTGVRAATDLIRIGGRAARDAGDINGWVAWMNVAREGCDAALWLARQIDIEDPDLAPLSDALRDAAGAWPEGAAHALRGSYTTDFQSTLERLPRSDDVGTMFAALTSMGLPDISGIGVDAWRPRGPLLDVAATDELYGAAIADFIRASTADPVWRQGLLGEAVQRRNESLLAELGVFGELAMRGESGGSRADHAAAVRAVISQTVNPVGKLLVVMFTPNLDAMAYAGLRTEAQRRCVRLLIEWRRRIARSEELPATAMAWTAAGLDVRDLEDPFSGRPLHFDADRLRVWSMGIDGIDNHGTGDAEVAVEGADFWWSLERP